MIGVVHPDFEVLDFRRADTSEHVSCKKDVTEVGGRRRSAISGLESVS